MATASASTAPRVDIYARVTNRIVEQLEQGIRPWMQPWNAEHAAGRITRPLRHNGQPYKGINILQLWASAEIAGYACPIWLTFQQAKELGGHVKKGEHGSPVVYASTFKKTDKTEDGQETEEEIPFLKAYTVFNVEQCEGCKTLPFCHYVNRFSRNSSNVNCGLAPADQMRFPRRWSKSPSSSIA